MLIALLTNMNEKNKVGRVKKQYLSSAELILCVWFHVNEIITHVIQNRRVIELGEKLSFIKSKTY